MLNVEQEVRIGLLHHFGSLMNGYKTYILALFAACLALIPIWVEWVQPSQNICLIAVWSYLLVAIITGIFFCIEKFIWLGKVVEATVYMPQLWNLQPPPTIREVQERIFDHAEQVAKEGPFRMNPILRRLAFSSRYTERFLGKCAVMWLIAGSLLFIYATLSQGLKLLG